MAIVIGSAPEAYRNYLTLGDEKGDKNGVIDNQEEAKLAKEALCQAEPDNCQKFIEYLEAKGYFHFRIQLPNQEPSYLPTSWLIKPAVKGYEGGTKKPLFEIDLGLSFGGGFYRITSLNAEGWGSTVQPNLGINYNLSERIKVGYNLGYAFAWIDENDIHAITHKLGISYDVLHHWTGETRKSAIELNLGGGLLLKNLFPEGESSSFNVGGFGSVELGVVAGWGDQRTFPRTDPFEPIRINEGWSKIALEFTASKGRDITDYIALLGIKFCFEIYK